MRPVASFPDREELREAVFVALTDFVPSCLGRIFRGRTWPQQGVGVGSGTNFPAILIRDGVRVCDLNADGFAYLRTQVSVAVRAQGRDDVAREQQLDEIEEQVRLAFFASMHIRDLTLAVESITSERESSVDGLTTLSEDTHLVILRMGAFVAC